MREIKFRAWDKEINNFVDIQGFFKNASKHKNRLLRSSGEIIASAEASNFFYAANTCELMQYTGLKDKNGKEIYEGDIVKRHFFTDYDYYCNVSELIGEVIFEDGAFIVKNRNYITPLFMEIQECNGEAFKHYEVIGNIYENSELLESEANNE